MVARTHGVRWLTVAVVVALVGAFGASPASAAPPPGVSMEGTGKPPSNLGLFSSAALAQKNCASNGQMTSTYEGGGPYCVNPWPAGKKNGGATAQGVTATTVKVVAYVPNDQTKVNSTNVDVATGQTVPIADALADWQKAYDAIAAQYGTYQLWGREPVIETVVQSGADETSQRADALTVIAKKPFIVFDMTLTTTGGATVFSSLVAAKKIPVVSASTDAQNSAQQNPYRWNYGADPSSGTAIAAALVGKALTGQKAQWAGDALKDKTRSFGAIYPTTGLDFASFEKYLAQNGGKLADKEAYDPATATAGAAQISTMVSKLKSTGVTSVVLFATPTVVPNILAAATSQDYSPEWIFTGLGYQDYDVFARTYDQQQMQHAFGLATLGPAVTGAPTNLGTFQWYWGTAQGRTWGFASGLFEFLYNAMHYAGPTLTAQNIQKGLYSAPAHLVAGVSIGLAGYGNTVGLPYPETALFGSSLGLAWWDGNTTGPSNGTVVPTGKGVFQYLNNGVNLTYKDLVANKKKLTFFDAAGSVVQRQAADFYPGGTLPTPLPCTGCPSSTASASSS